MNELSNLRPPRGATKTRKRLGRGVGSGLGKTAGKGHKGQKARKSPDVGTYFEGGQMPMQRRLPKIGFTNIFAKKFVTVNVAELTRFPAGARVDEVLLRATGLIKGRFDAIKILGDGDLDRALTVVADKFTRTAEEKITAAGGTVEKTSGAEV
ncbi:MAG: 50S ribosomal protein L15 [Myxococcota bacterium]|jgi:large subunit ribosomal protein L15